MAFVRIRQSNICVRRKDRRPDSVNLAMSKIRNIDRNKAIKRPESNVMKKNFKINQI